MLIIHMFGGFGWHAMPLVFAVFSRALLWVMTKKVVGVIDIYVDDFMGLSHRSTAQADQMIVQSICKATFGSDALADDNLVPSSEADILGFRVDLTLATIRPSDKGIRKLAFVFFSVDLNAETWPLRTCQIVASLSDRYSNVIVGLRPFVDCFNKLTGKFSSVTITSPNSKRKLSSLARCAVTVWRAVILLMDEYPSILAVPLRSLSLDVNFPPQFGLLSDAASGLGLKVWGPNGVIMFARYDFRYDSFQGNTQNVREFLGELFGLMVIYLQFHPPRGTRVAVRGDNMSALSWLGKNKSKSQAAHYGFLAYTWVIIITGFVVCDIQHIPGASDEMFHVDALSRGASLVGPSWAQQEIYRPHFDNLFALCDPSASSCTLDNHLVALNKVILLLRQILK